MPNQDLFNLIINKIKGQSVVFLLLALFTYYFYLRVEKLEELVFDCQAEYRSTLLEFLKEHDLKDTYKNSMPIDHDQIE